MAEEIPLGPVVKPTKETKTDVVKPTKVTKTKPANKMVSDMAVAATEGPTPCAADSVTMTPEDDAFTFGETEISYHQVNVSSKEVQRK